MSDRLLKESDVLRAVDERVEELSKSPVFLRKNGRIDVLGIKKYILAIPSADKWIPRSERLPSEYGNYLITTEDGEVDIGTYDPDSGLKWSGCDADGFYWFSNGAILAWKPLPTAYKGEDNG